MVSAGLHELGNGKLIHSLFRKGDIIIDRVVCGRVTAYWNEPFERWIHVQQDTVLLRTVYKYDFIKS